MNNQNKVTTAYKSGGSMSIGGKVLLATIGVLCLLVLTDMFFDRYSLQSPVVLRSPVIRRSDTQAVPSPSPRRMRQDEKKAPLATPTPSKKKSIVKQVEASESIEPVKKYFSEQNSRNRDWVLNYVSKYYSGDELIAFDNLMKSEASYDPTKVNSIGCEGIGQACPNPDGSRKMDCPLTQEGLECQVQWVIGYLNNRYSGSPTVAWKFWLAKTPINGQDVGNWY